MIRNLLIKSLFFLGVVCSLGLSLYAFNAKQWPHYFDNRVIADKSPPQKTELPIPGDGFQLSQTVDLNWVNVSDPRLLTEPFCLGLMLSPGSGSVQDTSAHLQVELVADAQRWVWKTAAQDIRGGYTGYCTQDQRHLNNLVNAQKAKILITSIGGSSSNNLANAILAPAVDEEPAFVNGQSVEARRLPFKIDAHPSPTIVDLFKYAVLLLLASLMVFLMSLAARRDWKEAQGKSTNTPHPSTQVTP
jgi:hypothetical protein